MKSCLDEINSKHRKLPKHKLNLKLANEVHRRVEAAGVNNQLPEVDQEVVDSAEVRKVGKDKDEEGDSHPTEAQAILLEQDVAEAEPRRRKIGTFGFTSYNIYAKKTCFLLAFLSFLKRDAKRMPILCRTKTSAQQLRRVLFT